MGITADEFRPKVFVTKMLVGNKQIVGTICIDVLTVSEGQCLCSDFGRLL